VRHSLSSQPAASQQQLTIRAARERERSNPSATPIRQSCPPPLPHPPMRTSPHPHPQQQARSRAAVQAAPTPRASPAPPASSSDSNQQDSARRNASNKRGRIITTMCTNVSRRREKHTGAPQSRAAHCATHRLVCPSLLSSQSLRCIHSSRSPLSPSPLPPLLFLQPSVSVRAFVPLTSTTPARCGPPMSPLAALFPITFRSLIML